MTKQPIKLIQSIQRAIDILDCFSLVNPNLSIHDISEKVNLNVNTARGIINTLLANKLLIYNKSTNLYSLGNYFIGRANIINKRFEPYLELFKPMVDEIANTYKLSASLQIVSQDEISSIYCTYPDNAAYYIMLSENSALSLHATSSGKLLLVHHLLPMDPNILDELDYQIFTDKTIKSADALHRHLEEIAKLGYSWETEEFNLGVASMAVPIFSQDHIIGTISATFFESSRANLQDQLLEDLRKAASKMSTSLST